MWFYTKDDNNGCDFLSVDVMICLETRSIT